MNKQLKLNPDGSIRSRGAGRDDMEVGPVNKQFKMIDGKKVNTKIEWTDYTSNPVGGCHHGCRWVMPDGDVAICYADTTATKFRSAYPDGFEPRSDDGSRTYYWRPQELEAWSRLKDPAKIFLDSMSDLFGAWVDGRTIYTVLAAAREAHWHTFQSLTKHAPRLLEFADELPPNLWVGVSTPPDVMFGKPLSPRQQTAMLGKTLRVLETLRARGVTTWLSIEPLSWDIAPLLKAYPTALAWAVIGAASSGRTYYAPDRAAFEATQRALDNNGVPTFYKGNLRILPDAVVAWREDFPEVAS